MGSNILTHLYALGEALLPISFPFCSFSASSSSFTSLVISLSRAGAACAFWCFSIGFGPELFGFNDRHGTRWKLAAIPLGGYVKFHGDANGASVPDESRLESMDAAERAQSFFFQPVWKRVAIVAAGPVANFILAIVIFSGILMLYGKQTR